MTYRAGILQMPTLEEVAGCITEPPSAPLPIVPETLELDFSPLQVPLDVHLGIRYGGSTEPYRSEGGLILPDVTITVAPRTFNDLSSVAWAVAAAFWDTLHTGQDMSGFTHVDSTSDQVMLLGTIPTATGAYSLEVVAQPTQLWVAALDRARRVDPLVIGREYFVPLREAMCAAVRSYVL